MAEYADDIVITLDPKRLFALGILAIISVMTVTSYMVALSQFTSPSQEFRFQGSVGSIEDYYFASASSFSAGETVRITGIVLYADQYWAVSDYYSFVGTISAKWIVVVLDPNHLPVHMESGTLTGAGQSDQELPEVSFVLPGSAASGLYTIRVMAWSDWLPTGDTLTVKVEEDTFAVG
jgi:hypothetical protein